MATLLIGQGDVASMSDISNGYNIGGKYIAVATGTLNQLKVKFEGSCNAKFAIYSDSAGSPNALLNETASTAVIAGINTITFPDTSIVSGTAYWLCANHDTNSQLSRASSGSGVAAYKAMTYTNAFPATYGTPDGTPAWVMITEGYSTASGPANAKTWNGLVIASVKTRIGLAIADNKT